MDKTEHDSRPEMQEMSPSPTQGDEGKADSMSDLSDSSDPEQRPVPRLADPTVKRLKRLRESAISQQSHDAGKDAGADKNRRSNRKKPQRARYKVDQELLATVRTQPIEKPEGTPSNGTRDANRRCLKIQHATRGAALHAAAFGPNLHESEAGADLEDVSRIPCHVFQSRTVEGFKIATHTASLL